MENWKDKIFDDFWKYLVGLAGGSSITGVLIENISRIQIWVWVVILVLFLVAVSFLLYWAYPSFSAKWSKRRTYKNWIKLKDVITEFHSPDTQDSRKEELQKEYKELKSKLEVVVSCYHLRIQNYLNSKYQNRGNRVGDLTFGNFKQCFYPQTLASWTQHVRRRIPDELHCFDEFAREIVSL